MTTSKQNAQSLDKMRELTRRLIAVPKSEITPKPKRKTKKRPR